MNASDLKPANPFPGLRPFRSDEHHLFFGREEQTAALLQLLRTHRFLAVVGTSGSGKSSLVRAGMIAELYGGTMTRAGSTWEVLVLRPGGSPIENLARAFVDAGVYDSADPDTRPRLLATLNRSRFGLVEAMKQSEVFAPGVNLLVVVDQFEELFRFRRQGVDSEETAAAFVNLLLTASEQSECPIYVTITMRSDYLGECSEIPGLAEAVNKGEYLIPRLQRDQKRDAIEKPIGVGGAKISPLLVQRLLNDVGDDPDQLPVLQHALMRIWDVWSAGHGHNRPIDFSDFEATGGLASALSNHADEIYDSLPDDQHRFACSKIFKALTVKGEDNRGIRRPTRLAQLQAIAASDRGTVTTVLDAFRGPGVTFLMPGLDVELRDRTVLDLSHESLMRCWQRLRGWVESEASSARIYRRLVDTARLWRDGKAGLFRDPDLQIALSWRDEEQPNAEWADEYGGDSAAAIDFLEASNADAEAERQAKEAARQRELEQARQLAEAQQLRLKHQQRAARKLRVVIGGLAVVALIAGVACLAALAARSEAKNSATVAEQEKVKALDNAKEAVRQRTAAQAARNAEEKIAAQARADRDVAQRDNYRSTIRLAESMLQGDARSKYRVADVLWGAQPELRGWEWGYLMARCPLEQWSLQTNQGGLETMAASPDGRFLATAGGDGTVALWDAWTRKELWRQKTGRVHSLDIDSLGQYVGLSATDESQPLIRILDRATGRLLAQKIATSAASVAFNPGGRDFYVCGSSKLERFNARKWEPFVPIATRELTVVSADRRIARRVFADSAGAYVGLHDTVINTERQSILFDSQTLRPVTEFDRILPDGSLNLASVSKPILHSGLGTIVYTEGPMVFEDTLDWRTRKSSTPRQLFEHSVVISHLAYDPLARTVVAAGDDGSVIYSENDGKTRTLWHGAPISDLLLLPDGRFVTGGADGLLKCWKLGATAELSTNRNAAPDSASASFVAFAGDNLLFQNWVRSKHFLFELSPPRMRLFARPEVGEYGLNFPAIRPQTNEMVVDGPSGLTFYSLERRGLMPAKRKHIKISEPHSAAFDAAGRLMVVSKKNGEIAVFDLNSDKQLPVPEARGPGIVAINRAGKLGAILTKTGVRCWDVATGRLLQRIDYDPGAGPVLDAKTHDFGVAPVFHPDGEILAFVENSATSRTLVLWDTTLGRRAASIRSEPGMYFPSDAKCQVACVFSADGNRVFIPCSDAKVRIWDWRLGKEVLALSDAKQTLAVAFAPDGVTVAYAGWAPSLRIARALPYKGTIHRDKDFFRAVDDFRIYTARVPRLGKNETDEMELFGDIHLHRGENAEAKKRYEKAIANVKKAIVEEPTDLKLQSRLAALYEKRFAAANAASAKGGADALQSAVKFWEKLKADPSAKRYLLRAQTQLVDRLLTQDEESGIEFVRTSLESWIAQAEKEKDNHFATSGLRELLARLAWVCRKRGDRQAIDRLISAHPSVTATIGDLDFGDNEWKSAIATYDKVITDKTTNAELLGRRARANEELRNWDAASADWLRAADKNPEGAKLLVEYSGRLAAAGKASPADAIRAKARAMFGDKLVKEAENAPAAVELSGLLAKIDVALTEKKRWTEIEPLISACLALHEKLGVDHPDTLESMNRLGYAYWDKKHYEEAIRLLEQCVKLEVARYGRGDPKTLLTLANLGANYVGAGRAKEAIPLLEEAHRAAKKHPALSWVMRPLLEAYTIAGENVKVAELLLPELPLARRSLPKDSPQLAGLLAQIGLGLLEQKKWSEAERTLRECLAIREKQQPDAWTTFNTKSMLGGVLLGQKKYSDAETLLLTSFEEMKKRESEIPPQARERLPEAADRLIELYTATNRPDDLKKWQAERAKYPIPKTKTGTEKK